MKGQLEAVCLGVSGVSGWTVRRCVCVCVLSFGLNVHCYAKYGLPRPRVCT